MAQNVPRLTEALEGSSMTGRPPYLPTKEQRAAALAALAENATYDKGLDAVERLTARTIAEYLEPASKGHGVALATFCSQARGAQGKP